MRQVRVRGHRYLQIVESYWINGKATPRHRVLAYLGRCDEPRFQEVRRRLRDWRPMVHAPAFLAEVQDTTQPLPQPPRPPFRWRR